MLTAHHRLDDLVILKSWKTPKKRKNTSARDLRGFMHAMDALSALQGSAPDLLATKLGIPIALDGPVSAPSTPIM